MATPKHRASSGSSYFVTTKCWQGRGVFDVAENAEILLATLFHYRDAGAYLLHEFVVMPEHLHLLLTPCATTTLERAVQLIKGGSSHRIHEQRERRSEVWQKGFYDWTVRDIADWNAKVEYIRMNPVRARLVALAEEWPYSSASKRFSLDPVPKKYSGLTSGAKAPVTCTETVGLKPHPPEMRASGAKAPAVRAGTAGLKSRPPGRLANGASLSGVGEKEFHRESRR